MLVGTNPDKPPKWRHGKGIHKAKLCCTRSKCWDALGVTNEANAADQEALLASEAAPAITPTPLRAPAAATAPPPPSDPTPSPNTPMEQQTLDDPPPVLAPASSGVNSEPDWQDRPIYSTADLKAEFEAGREQGRVEAESDRKRAHEAEQVVEMMQNYLLHADRVIQHLKDELELTLDPAGGSMSLDDLWKIANPLQSDVLAGLRWARLLQVVGLESVGDLCARARANRASHGE